MSELGLSIDEYLTALRREGALMAATILVADLDGAVPTCPEWTVRELTHHLGRAHIWAAAHVEQLRDRPLSEDEVQVEWGAIPVDAELVAWYGAAVDRVVTAIDKVSPHWEGWRFLADAPLARLFWARRQAHELAIHRVDAQGAVDPRAVDDVSPAFAVDGIEELLFGFYGRRRSRLRDETPHTLSIRAAEASWLVHIGPEGARTERSEEPGDCTVQGSANELYYALWNRLPLGKFHVAGDAGIIDKWTTTATIAWS